MSTPNPIDESKLLPKILGGDYELTNFIEGETMPSDEAADAILAEIDGVPAFRGLKPFKNTGNSCSWGAHHDYLISREAFERLCHGLSDGRRNRVRA